MAPALKRARAFDRAEQRSAARGARQEAELRHENRPMIFIGSPLPRHEILARANTVRFAGGDVPASNTCGAHPELVTVDPLNTTRMLSQADRLNHADAIYTEGALEDGETFAEWDIYSGVSNSVEDEIVAMLDGDIDTSQETIADRIAMGTADFLDIVVFLHLETGEGIDAIANRLCTEAEDDYSWYVDNDEDTFPEILAWAGTGKPKLTKVQERGRKNRRLNNRSDQHRKNKRYDRGFSAARDRKEAWLKVEDWSDWAIELDAEEQTQLEEAKFWHEVAVFDREERDRLLDTFEEDRLLGGMGSMATEKGTDFSEKGSTEPDSEEIVIRRSPPADDAMSNHMFP